MGSSSKDGRKGAYRERKREGGERERVRGTRTFIVIHNTRFEWRISSFRQHYIGHCFDISVHHARSRYSCAVSQFLCIKFYARFEQNHRKSLSLQFCRFYFLLSLLFFLSFFRRGFCRRIQAPNIAKTTATSDHKKKSTATNLKRSRVMQDMHSAHSHTLMPAHCVHTNDEAIYYRANRPKQTQQHQLRSIHIYEF